MKELINFIKTININYIITSILFLIVLLLFINEKNKLKGKKLYFILLYILIASIGLYYLNDIFNNIFNLKLISLKIYIIVTIIISIIMLITINKKINKSYKILNKTLYTINTIILLLNLILVTGIKQNYFITNPLEIIKLINISLISFIIYLNLICLVYISKKIIIKIYNKKHKLINGKDCSIIFEDKNKENRKKNYKILKKDINGILTNGYTLDETITIKNIINKLQITDINNLNLNINKLNRITQEEYILLKRFINSHSKYQEKTE